MAVGEAITMLDSVARVTGAVPYASGLRFPGMLVGRVVRSEVPHALLAGVNADDARRVPGVVAIVTGAELKGLTGTDAHYGSMIRDQPVLATDRVRFVGEPLALVAAETAEAAEEALRLIEVRYDEIPAVFDVSDALAHGAPRLHEVLGDSNVLGRAKLRHGDLEKGFAEADLVIEGEYSSPAAQHVSLETHAAVGQWSEGRLMLWTGTQSPHVVRNILAGLFDLPADRVRVIAPPLGGGFGGKGAIRIEPMVAVLARAVEGRPVMIQLSRAEEFVTVTKHATSIHIRSGVRRDGRLTARQVTVHMNGGAYADVSPALIRSIVPRSLGPYRLPAASVDVIGVYTNLPSAAAYRGAVANQATWAYESHTDVIAEQLGVDPLEFRVRNLLQSGDKLATGETLHGIHYERCLRTVADAIDWDQPFERLSGPLRRGRGLAVMMKSTAPTSRSECVLSLRDDGGITLRTSTVELGQGSHTALAQITAQALGIGVERVQVVGPDTDVTPFDTTTSSSRSTAMMGGAIEASAAELILQLRTRAAHLMERPIEDLTDRRGTIVDRNDPASRLGFADILQRLGLTSLEATGAHATELGIDPETGRGTASPHWHQGAGACDLEVDTETGHVRILRYAASSFAGIVVNPALAKLQNDGNVIFGLGPTFTEEIVFDHGQVVNPNLADYLIPSFRDMPQELISEALEDGSEVHGIGEMTMPPVAPAIGNAIADALGMRFFDLPLTPERILRAIEDQAADARERNGSTKRHYVAEGHT